MGFNLQDLYTLTHTHMSDEQIVYLEAEKQKSALIPKYSHFWNFDCSKVC